MSAKKAKAAKTDARRKPVMIDPAEWERIGLDLTQPVHGLAVRIKHGASRRPHPVLVRSPSRRLAP